jgi:hypothetical protein
LTFVFGLLGDIGGASFRSQEVFSVILIKLLGKTMLTVLPSSKVADLTD